MTTTARTLLLLVLSLWLGACSYSPEMPGGGNTRSDTNDTHSNNIDNDVRHRLYAQYDDWRGVRYRNGGLSKAGVDCSGLVYLTYRDRFGVTLPRSTRDLVNVGTPVAARQWRSGDLVFFRISQWTNHVGIYLEDGKFLHASTSSGVMISHVDEPYWRQRYWKATRLDNNQLARRD